MQVNTYMNIETFCSTHNFVFGIKEKFYLISPKYQKIT